MAGMQQGMPPQGGQQGQPQQQMPQLPPELLMALLTHLSSGAAQSGAPAPKDGTQVGQGQLGQLLPGLLQALTQGQQPGQGQSPQGQGQGGQPQQKPQQQQGSQGQSQQNPASGILSLLKGLNLSFK